MFPLLLLAVAVPSTAGAQHTVRDQVLRGVFEEVILVDHPSLSLRDLTSASGAVVHAVVRNSDTFVSSDGTTIMTDYRMAVVDVVKESSGSRISAGDVITVRRVGGVMNVEGRRVFANEGGFPPFSSGGEYVLFLKTDSGQPFEMTAGSQSAFGVNRGRVAPLGDAFDRSAPLLPMFLHDVRELLAARPEFTR